MKNNPFLSIIIPVYNGLTHELPVCLDSIWSQPLDKELYEVICIDDCSSDNTNNYLSEQTLLHDNLHIFTNIQNLRQGGSRNKGVANSRGKYILFIDQDDYYHTGSLLQIYEHLQNNEVDILVSDSAYQFKGHEHNNLQLNFAVRGVMSGDDFIIATGGAWAPWRCAINRLYYISHGFQFVENKRMEDIDWASKLFFYAKKVEYVPILLVHYNKSTTSTTDNLYRDIETLSDVIDAGNRTIAVANTLYKYSKAYNNIIKLGCWYRYESIKCLLGLFASISAKQKILALAAPIVGMDSALVKFAIKHSHLYCTITNLSVPAYRVIRKLHRYRLAFKMSKS